MFSLGGTWLRCIGCSCCLRLASSRLLEVAVSQLELLVRNSLFATSSSSSSTGLELASLKAVAPAAMAPASGGAWCCSATNGDALCGIFEPAGAAASVVAGRDIIYII